jgi:hypothetical protein
MGKRGPQPQPAELRKLRGNPGKRAIPKTPTGDPTLPVCPAELKHLKKSWDYYGGILVKLKILCNTDGLAWGLLWTTFDNYMDARKIGDIGLQLRVVKAIVPLLDRFGMSPSSRASLNIEAPKEEDEFSKFLKKRANA